jgi:hypothetical protein
MVCLAFARLVNACIWIIAREPKVSYMAKQVSFSVLHSQVTQLKSDDEEGNRRFPFRPAFSWQSFYQYKATATEHFFK